MVAPRFDDSRWFHPGGYPPPPRVPLSLVALALSLRRATGVVPPFEMLTRLIVMARNGVGATPHNVGGVPVARCKRSAPAKHPVRGAGDGVNISGY